jgi:hypothetical protein
MNGGPDYDPSPWANYGGGQQAGGKPGDERFPDMKYGGGFFARPPRKPNFAVVAGIVAAVVVVGLGIWWFAGGPGRPAGVAGSPSAVSGHQVTITGTPSPQPLSQPNSALSNPPAAYDLGSCFDEQPGTQAGRVELNPVTCDGDQAVFVIDKIVTRAADCDVGFDYHQHGYEVPDETAHVAYCAALVVPATKCFVLGGGQPVTRTVCGSGPYVVEVLAVENASDVKSACADKVNPDVWYFQSAKSGQYACVSRPAANPSGTTTPTS